MLADLLPPDRLFQIASMLALPGWLALAVLPLAPRAAAAVALAVALAQSTLYAALILTHWAGAAGGFASLAEVMRLFDQPGVALAGWVHYLGFDLLVGLWIARSARDAGIPHLLVLPCLGLTFLFGPVGLLCFLILAAARGRKVLQ